MILYNSDEENFDNCGFGILRDAYNVYIKRKINSIYELTFDYPKSGFLANNIDYFSIIKADGQLFRINDIKKTRTNYSITAQHIMYDLNNNFLEDVAPTNQNGNGALNWILERTVNPHNFTGFSNIQKVASARYVRKNVINALLGEGNAVVKRWGGEIDADNFQIKLLDRLGSDRGLILSLQKNITGLNITINISDLVTKIMPVGVDGLLLPEKYVESPLINNYPFQIIRILSVDSAKIDEEMQASEAYAIMRQACLEQFNAGIDKPKINVKIDFVELSKTEEYKKYMNMETVHLGDTVSAFLPEYNINTKLRVISTTKNVLKDKFEKIELGDELGNFAKQQISIIEDLKYVETENINLYNEAISAATQMLTRALGGYVVKTQSELFIMDTDDITTATKVWRWNLNGLGYSSSGINGPYSTAITQDGSIVADFITAGVMSVDRIQGLAGELASININLEGIQTDVRTVDGKYSSLNQRVDEIDSRISDIADITVSAESSYATVNLDNINQSEPIYVKVHPINANNNISYLYPNSGLYPHSSLYLKNRTLRFCNNTTGEIFDYVIPDDLLYYDAEHYDEFILSYDSQICQVNKKCKYNADGSVGLLSTERIDTYTYPAINLTDGDYTVSLLGYNYGYLQIKLMAQNIYTTQFSTRAEVNTKINQKANEIDLSVDTKLSNYSTTTEMNSAINIAQNSITSEVRETYSTKTQTANAKNEAISAAASDVDSKLQNYSTTTEMNAAITQKANEITSSVSQTYATKTTTNSLSSRIKQTAKTIELTTTDNSTSAGIVIKLKNEDGTQIDSKSANISMSGLVKFIDLSTSGSTEINGSNITTGVLKSNNYVSGSTGTKFSLTDGTIDSQNFKLDNQGNVSLKNGAKVIGGSGLRTNLQYCSVGKFQGYSWLGFDGESNGSYISYYKSDVSVEVDIPTNFTVVSAKLTLYHTPINWSYTDSNYQIQSVNGYSRNLKLYKASDTSNYQFNMMRFSEGKINPLYLSATEISNAFGASTYTPSNTSGNSIVKKETIDISSSLNSAGKHKLVVRTNDSVPSDEYTACAKTGMARIVVDVIGYMNYSS